MNNKQIIDWLLQGDVSIQYQVHRDLLNKDKIGLKRKIILEGWGARFLSFQNENGHWGRGFYQPKWISTHYTLLDLKNLGIPGNNRKITLTLLDILNTLKGADGGI